MGTVGINLARFEIRDKDMPVVIGALPVSIERDDLCRLASFSSSNNNSSINTAFFEKTLKLTPPGKTVAPRGALAPCLIPMPFI